MRGFPMILVNGAYDFILYTKGQLQILFLKKSHACEQRWCVNYTITWITCHFNFTSRLWSKRNVAVILQKRWITIGRLSALYDMWNSRLDPNNRANWVKSRHSQDKNYQFNSFSSINIQILLIPRYSIMLGGMRVCSLASNSLWVSKWQQWWWLHGWVYWHFYCGHVVTWACNILKNSMWKP